MILNSLSLINYKNFDSRSFELDAKINCFVGDNGVGKTNVLDAVYHLSFGKSYFNPVTSQNINHNADFFVIDGHYRKNDREEKVIVSAKRGQKKLIKRNGKAYERLSEHIGFLPLVIISPADRDLIIEGSSTRRKFIDGVISQSDNAYLNDLMSYTKILSQRNALLKYFAANRTYDPDTLGIYNEQMTALGTRIFKKRSAFLEAFKPIFQERYTAISGGRETVQLKYKSQLRDTPLDQLFTEALQKDRMMQYTTVGTHKDDLSLKIEGHHVKKFGSQGQQKSFLIALKLAQFDFIKKQSGTTPLLLLDDIFDKLDEKRVAQIINLVNDANFGQLLLTDTHSERTEAIVKEIHQSYKIFNL
ncbi:DNA replication/repair protein RecF [Flavimarina sp. Hel_I_48]|uniref:DNA replication/repair protein RecF n=1 Tax=Flavimarina sp. Hel_I_48 TaxID=1392488 RepID=UPI0004DFBC4C|nr:DNA replication/repair protein RecF [Flavimarina sp. Hel_I_48]